jgi:hypothetical protein
MRWVVLAVIGAALIVQGQEAKPRSNGGRGRPAAKSSDATDTAGQTVVVVNQPAGQGQQDSKPNNPPSYFSRLFSPENLPNICLVGAGILGIIVAIRTLNHMRESSERQLRAYVLPELGNIVNIAAPLRTSGTYTPTDARITHPDWGPVVIMHVKNTGQTPAFKVVHWGNMCFREYPLASTLPPRAESPVKSVSTIGPGIINTKRLGFGPPLTEQQIAQLRNATGAIYVYGEISYEDAFGKQHLTRYRAFHNQNSGAIGISTDLTFTEDGNEAD